MKSRPFCVLPPEVHTPDGMEIDGDGNLMLSCFNLVTGPDKVSKSHATPCTPAYVRV